MSENHRDIALKLQGIIDTAIDGIITISDKGLIESMNKSASTLFGYEEEEVIGKNVSMLMPEPHKSDHDQYMRRYQKTREKKIIGIGREVSGKRKDGSIFPIRLAVGEVFLNNRVIFTGIIHDLSDFKDVQNKLIELNNELEQKVLDRTQELSVALSREKDLSELKSRFVTMASHEFRTPLSTILSSASLIARYPNTLDHPKREKHINRIKSSVANLTGILNDFLSLSRLEEGKVAVNRIPVNIPDLINEIADEISTLLKGNQSLTRNIDIDVTEIDLDERVLKNILFNLLSNAIKYSGMEGKIRCDVSMNNGSMKILVSDNGMGIPEEDQKHLFQRFFRASNVENIQGTGLGLHIVKQYVELLHGTISFKSNLGEGTTFFIEIPI
ncbi:MAG: PAS domain-containing sensor histidine kinase [Bacteroidia bacterium]|nr:PAS domain-containing sensor histidine kinase [Bacteroidia bacterium]